MFSSFGRTSASAGGPCSPPVGPPRGLACRCAALALALIALAVPPGRGDDATDDGHHHAAAPVDPDRRSDQDATRGESSVSITSPEQSRPQLAGIGDIFSKKTTEIAYQTIESWREGDLRITVLLGNVEMRQEGVFLRSDSVVGWSNEVAAKAREDAARAAGGKAPSEPIFDEFYAEGFVRLVREFEMVEADQMYFDLQNHTGLVVDTTIRTMDAKNKLPLVVRAAELRQLDRTRYVAENARITTCDYGDPHLSVKVGTVEFERDRSGGKVAFSHLSTETGGIPFFYLPFYWTRIGQAYPLRSITYTNSGRLGHTVRTDWGFDIKKTVRDSAGEIVRDEEGKAKTKKWGDVLVNLDYMTKRGPGAGVDLEYGWDNYTGFLNTYYVNDEGAGSSSDLDRRVRDPYNHNRWRVKAFHRQHLSPFWRADFEYSQQSDRNFLEEFFEKEFQEGKAQETYAYLRYRRENVGGTLFYNFRRNNFQNQNEYMPQASFYYIAEPLFGSNFYYTNHSEVANVRSRYDDQLDLDSDRIWRFDTYHEFSYPIDLSAVQVAPFVAARYSAFEDDLTRSGGADRLLATAGLRAFTQLHRAYDTKWDWVGLRGLRHIIALDARYTNNLESSKDHHELIPYDRVEAADAFEELSLELRQRFQTRNEAGDSFEFLSLGIEAEYYPDATRDVLERNNQNFLYPMNWIPVAPTQTGRFQDRNWSNLHVDAQFTPNAPFSLRWDMEYNQYGEGVEVNHATASYTPSDKLRITLGHNFVDGFVNALSLGVRWQATEKWRISWEEQWDFDRGVFLSNRLGLQRDMHDYQVEVFADLDEGKDDLTVGFLIAPAKKGRSREPFLDNYGYLRDH